MITISLCLSDIPKELIQTGKNGKKYLNLCIDNKKQPDDYGNTHAVWIQQSKEERQAKTPKIYLGNGKEYIFQNQQTQQSSYNPPVNTGGDDNDDLPF